MMTKIRKAYIRLIAYYSITKTKRGGGKDGGENMF